MDFKKAADIITSSSSSATPAKPAQTAAEVSAQKKSAIRFLSDSLFTSPPR